MKRIALACLLFVMTSLTTASACAICGCGSGNYYLGLMPQFGKNFVGLRYRTYSFRSHLGTGYKPFEATHETFQSMELWTRLYLTQRIQIISLVNYNFNEQLDQGVTKTINGIGDIPVIVNYNIINTTNQPLSDERLLNHSLFLGAGIKLPTGKYKYIEDPKIVANPNFQLGTGSVDLMLTSLYTLRFKRSGLSADVNYKINGQNSNEYKFGNRVSGTVSLFYVQQIKKLGLMPNAGVYFEDSQKNQQYGITIENTGGPAQFASMGIESYYKKISVGFNFQKPVVQHLASDHSKAENKAMVHFTFLF